MKFVLEEHDQRTIDNINKDIREKDENRLLFIDHIGSKYYIEFECVDVAKANVFAYTMMNPSIEKHKEIKETLGIDITAISYTSPRDREIENLKHDLKELLFKLEQM